MVINWEKVTKATGRFFLLLLELSIKFSAVVVTAVVLSSKGTIGTKLAAGFTSISASLRKVFNSPSEIIDRADIVYKYNTMNAASFDEQYGSQAVQEVFTYLQGGIVYLQEVYINFANRPFVTFIASVIAFGSLYLVSRVIRFSRQKGRGSYLTRLELKLSRRVFKHPKELKNGKPKQASKPKPKSKPKKSISIDKFKSKITSESKPLKSTKPVEKKPKPQTKPSGTSRPVPKKESSTKSKPQPASGTDKSAKKQKKTEKPIAASKQQTAPESQPAKPEAGLNTETAKPIKNGTQPKPEPKEESNPEAKSESKEKKKKKKKRVVKPFNAKAQKTNKHLQNFIKSAKKNRAL